MDKIREAGFQDGTVGWNVTFFLDWDEFADVSEGSYRYHL